MPSRHSNGRAGPCRQLKLPRRPIESVPDTQAQQLNLANLERDAFSKGFAQGERAGAEAAAKRGEAMLRRLTQTLEEITGLREQMIRQTEEQMVQLALGVARRIVHREVTLDKDLLIAMARVALDRLGESAKVTVRLNPEDFQATISAQAAAWHGTHVTVVADARVSRGGCRIDSDFGAIDAGRGRPDSGACPCAAGRCRRCRIWQRTLARSRCHAISTRSSGRRRSRSRAASFASSAC